MIDSCTGEGGGGEAIIGVPVASLLDGSVVC